MIWPSEPTRRDFLRAAGATSLASAGLLGTAFGSTATSKISYYKDGEIHINLPGQAESAALTTGHWDFKPSWSRTGDHLVFFRRYKDDPVTVNWLSAICIMNADGSGFHQLTDASIANFNPTWTRDGKNTPIWSRKNPKKGNFFVVEGKIGGKPGEEVVLTDPEYHTWVFSTLNDGRFWVSCNHPKQGWGYYLMTRGNDARPTYERINLELTSQGLLDRVSVSPSETKICFEFQKGFVYKDPGRTLYMADFDVKTRTVSNIEAFANAEGKPYWFAYPRWIDGESAIVYHRSAGKGALHVYRLADKSTVKVSLDSNADYRYPHGQAAPC